jgi:flagellar secretion chaperone FliS
MKFHADAVLRQYTTIGLEGLVSQASPHELVRMLMDGFLDRVSAARAQIANNDIAGKGVSLGRALGIIEGLRTSLDADAGGELAENLENLYDYIARRVVQASATNEVAALEEVSALMTQIRESWIAIGVDAMSQESTRAANAG